MTIEQLELEVRAALPLIGEGKRAIVGGREVFDEADLEAAVRAANSFHQLGMELDPTSQGGEPEPTGEPEPAKAPEESTENAPAETVVTPEADLVTTPEAEPVTEPEVKAEEAPAPAPKRGR